MRPAAVLAAAPRWARRIALVLCFYVLAEELRSGGTVMAAGFSLPGVALGGGLVLLLVASSAAALFEASVPWTIRLSRALVRLGLALGLAGVPASMVLRTAHLQAVGEGQEIGPAEVPGMPLLRLGRVELAPSSPHPILSKRVEIEAVPGGGLPPFRIGLFPPASLGPWRLSVTGFGYAPALDWLDATGRPLARGFVMLGTFLHTDEVSRLVAWTAAPNVMMGVGTFPPKLEDLLSPPGTPYHLFLRIEEADVAGARRDLRGPDAHRFLLDGRLEHPAYLVQVFRGKEKVFERRMRAGQEAAFAGGRVRLPDEVLLWVDLLAVRDPWLSLAIAGALAMAAGGLLRLAARARGG